MSDSTYYHWYAPFPGEFIPAPLTWSEAKVEGGPLAAKAARLREACSVPSSRGRFEEPLCNVLVPS